MIKRLAALLLLLVWLPVKAAAPAGDEASALDAATAALCSKQVSVLGEANHGDARTERFKINLIQRLVAQCGFGAVVFEASAYEFIALDRRLRGGQPLEAEHVAVAVGGLWRWDREFQPLLPYLADQASTGRLRLGGVDFQRGGRGQHFSNDGMIDELTATLRPAARARCRTTFRDLVYSGSTAARRKDGAECLVLIGAVEPSTDPQVRRERADMVANLAAFTAADPSAMNDYVARRDREMYRNYQRWLARWPKGIKVIVWTATAHAARGAHGHPTFEGVTPFGAYLARQYGQRSYALGFTAQRGTARGRPEPRVIAPLLPNALEALIGPLPSGGAMFLDKAALLRAGARPAGLFSNRPRTEYWGQLLDGVIVFDAEFPALDIRTAG